MNDVLVVGAGPVGLTMAAELARHGVRSRMIERRGSPLPYCRAIGATPRTLEIWADMGVARELIDAGIWLTGTRTIINGEQHDQPLDLSDLPYGQLGVPQYETERVLSEHLGLYGVDVERGVELVALEQRDGYVAVELEHADGTAEVAHARYLIGCDGAHSSVRKLAGIAFEGEAFANTFMLGDVHIEWDLPRGTVLFALRPRESDAPEMFLAVPLPEPGRYRVSTLASPDLANAGATGHGIQTESPGPDLAQLQAIADTLVPGQPRLSDLRWSSLFRISMRLASQYRRERVFIAGDAAHIHPPTGGQGMNTGIQDAYNLAWKLALVLYHNAPVTLLDSYEAERRPVGADVIARTRAASQSLGRKPAAPPHRLADTQILLNYSESAWVCDEPPAGSKASIRAGDRAPDCQGLRRAGIGFPLRMFEVLRGTDHVLLVDLTRQASIQTIQQWAEVARRWRSSYVDVVRVVAIVPSGFQHEAFALSVLADGAGSFAAAYGGTDEAWLVRPDGYVGWHGPGDQLSGAEAYLGKVLGPGQSA